MPDRDIVDAIDELVDWQLAKEPSGWDHNINQARCPHWWCDADFHPLPIKQRMREIRQLWRSAITYHEDEERVPEHVAAELDEYRYDTDESPVICPGSLFEGEFTPPPLAPRILGPREAIHTAVALAGDLIAAATGLPGGAWQLPDDPANPDAWLANAPRWWRCDDITGLRANVVDLMRNGLEAVHAPDRVGFWNHRWVLVTGREEIELYADRENPNPWNRGAEPGGRPWMEIYTDTPPSAGVWRPMHGVLDMADVTALQNLRYTAHVGGGVGIRSDIVTRQLQAEMQRAAREHFPGTVIHVSEMAVSSGSPTPSEAMADRYPVTARWVPKPVGGVLEGGPAHGSSVAANVERVETAAPVRRSIFDFRDPSPTVELNTVTYQRAAYDTVTRRWVYRPQRPAPRATVRPQAARQHLILAGSHRAATRYAQALGFDSRPLIITRREGCRGLDPSRYVIHYLGNPDLLAEIRIRLPASVPLESLMYTPGDQAA